MLRLNLFRIICLFSVLAPISSLSAGKDDPVKSPAEAKKQVGQKRPRDLTSYFQVDANKKLKATPVAAKPAKVTTPSLVAPRALSLSRPLAQDTHSTSLSSLRRSANMTSLLTATQPSSAVKLVLGAEKNHQELVQMINSAESSITISSKTLDFLPNDVYWGLINARKRNVAVRLLIQEAKCSSTYNSLTRQRVAIHNQVFTHAKVVIIDSKSILVGSYNFLSTHTAITGDSDIADIGESAVRVDAPSDKIEKIENQLIEDISLTHEGRESEADHLQFAVGSKSKFHFLTSLTHHEAFFRSMIKNAKERVLIFSPFVFRDNAIVRLKALQQVLADNEYNPEVEIYVTPAHRKFLDSALTFVPGLAARIKIVESDFHRKSLIVDPGTDECHLCEGSFNWLSAALRADSTRRNQEASVVLVGPLAQNLFGS